MPKHIDPFRQDRQQSGVATVRAEGQDLPMILRLNDIRRTCKDVKTFSSDNPQMIVLHSEAAVRDVRQLPIESDPPDHTDYRALVEPIFRKPQQTDYQATMRTLIASMVATALKSGEIEVVRNFSLPLQCRALAQLLGVPSSDADIWTDWGVHVFRDAELGSQGSRVDDYVNKKFDDMKDSDADDFFSTLNRIDFRGRKLTLQEKKGFASLAFAGGRDTVIHTVSSIFVYLAEHADAIEFLRADAARITSATEEFVRYVSPVTIITRTCPHATEVLGHHVDAGDRVALCWPSANRDETVFQNPDEVILDRSPNPHVGFGFGSHNCLGQHHARLIIRSLLEEICKQVDRIELLESTPEIETESSYVRQSGYKSARVKLIGKN
jgi:cytochrome P450